MEKWPSEETFPLLHIICANVGRESTTTEIAEKLYSLIKSNSLIGSSDSPQTRMSLRLLVSFFKNDPSRDVVLSKREEIIGDVNTLVEDLTGQESISPQVSFKV